MFNKNVAVKALKQSTIDDAEYFGTLEKSGGRSSALMKEGGILEFFLKYLEVVTGVVGFLLGSGITLTVQRFRQGNNASYSDQSNSRVGGDQAGRDINKS